MKQAERKVKLSTFEPDLGNASVGNEDHESRIYGKLLNQVAFRFLCYRQVNFMRKRPIKQCGQLGAPL